MKTSHAQLADVNVLIALVDSMSPWHDRAYQWLQRQTKLGWGTCPITENGLLRIISNPNYPTGHIEVAEAVIFLQKLKAAQGHIFVPDDLSFSDSTEFVSQLLGPKQITDVYLVELARKHEMKLATFDAKMKHLPKACQSHIAFI